LANNGVDLAPYHDFETVVPTSLKVEIASVKQGIINGTIPT
jgi:basic membrane protein A